MLISGLLAFLLGLGGLMDFALASLLISQSLAAELVSLSLLLVLSLARVNQSANLFFTSMNARSLARPWLGWATKRIWLGLLL